MNVQDRRTDVAGRTDGVRYDRREGGPGRCHNALLAQSDKEAPRSSGSNHKHRLITTFIAADRRLNASSLVLSLSPFYRSPSLALSPPLPTSLLLSLSLATGCDYLE